MRPQTFGIITAVLALALDQGFKHWAIFDFDIGQRQPLHLTSFFDLVLAWNPGISYSLFPANSDAARYGLLALALAATCALSIWLWRTRLMVTSVALGLLVGGALGNAVDRYVYGAVADFFFFHVGSFNWYVFNFADVAIAIGVALLLFESLGDRAPEKTSQQSVP
jgi:signal peptidase II